MIVYDICGCRCVRFLTLQDDDDLQILGAQRLGGELVQGTPSLDGVADDQRRNQEDAVTPQRVLHLDVELGHRDHLALRRHRPPDHLERTPQSYCPNRRSTGGLSSVA